MNNTLTSSRAADGARNVAVSPRRWNRVLRVTLYGMLLGVLALSFFVHRASAELSERSTGLGRALDRFADLEGRVTQLTFNGHSFSVSTKVVNEPIQGVLEHFIERCNQDTKALTSDLGRELGSTPGLTQSFFERVLVLRDMPDDASATAVCLSGLGEGGLAGLSARVQSFAQTWDLSDLGQLRYTFLRKAGQGTHIILVSSEGPLRLLELFPTDGRDVAGPEVVPGLRPAGSIRILAAAAAGTPHIVNAFQVATTPAAAMQDYGQKLEASGYRAVRVPSGYGTRYEISQNSIHTRGYVRGDHTLVTTSKPADDGGSVLAVVQIQRPLTSESGESDEHR